MKPAQIILLALVATALAAYVAFLRSQPEDQVPPDSAPSEATTEALEARLATIEERLTALEQKTVSQPSVPNAPISREQVEQWVLDLVAEQSPPEVASEAELDIATVVADLTDGRLPPDETAALWRDVREAKQVDAVVAELAHIAAEHPHDSMARTELGWGYFQKMRTAGGGPEAGRWGAKGAETMVEALEIDPTNWDARFTLAQHYFYAEMRGDAIHHLKLLVDQQAERRTDEKHVRAYLLLGNIYVDRGNEKDARKVWSDALELWPENSAVQSRLERFEKPRN